MIPHISPVRPFLAFLRAMRWSPFRLEDREANQQTVRREPPRESVFRSLAARAPRESRFGLAAL